MFNRHFLTTLYILFLLCSLPVQAVELGELQMTELPDGGPTASIPNQSQVNVRGKLCGTISDSTGGPISGAKVFFLLENNWVFYQTDKTGYYDIPVFRRYKNIEIVVRAEGFLPVRVIDVPIGMGLPEVNYIGQTTKLNVVLPKLIESSTEDSEIIVSYNLLTGCVQVAITDSTSGIPVNVVSIVLEIHHDEFDGYFYIERNLSTLKSGNYFARYIQPGNYDLKIWSNQFGRDIYSGLEIKAGDTTIVNLRLPLKKPEINPNTIRRYSR